MKNFKLYVPDHDRYDIADNHGPSVFHMRAEGIDAF